MGREQNKNNGLNIQGVQYENATYKIVKTGRKISVSPNFSTIKPVGIATRIEAVIELALLELA